MSESVDFKQLQKTFIDYFESIINLKFEEVENKHNERDLKLKTAINYSSLNENEEVRMYEHKGITCSRCKNKIIGIRYMCSICPYFNLCSTCEYTNDNDLKGHDVEHNFIKLRKEEDLAKFEGDYRFELDSSSFRLKINETNEYSITIKNTGTKDWPHDTFITPIEDRDSNSFDKIIVGDIEKGKDISLKLKFKELRFLKDKFCRTIINLSSESLKKKNQKFLFPCEIHFYKENQEEEVYDHGFFDE